MTERLIGSKRAQAMAFVLFTQRVTRALSNDNDGDRQSADMLMQLAEAIRQRMGAGACSFEDIMRTVDQARPTGSVLDEFPEEHTPAERPSGIASESEDERTWRRFLRGVFRMDK